MTIALKPRMRSIVVNKVNAALEPVLHDLMIWWDVDHDEAVKIVGKMFRLTSVGQRLHFLKTGELPRGWNEV